MRYLNKIIFLNSAHIPYAEVKLDGNVHFIGTQGVGKSTLLRALLFSTMPINLSSASPRRRRVLTRSTSHILILTSSMR